VERWAGSSCSALVEIESYGSGMTGNPEVDYANLLESHVFSNLTVALTPGGMNLLKTPFSKHYGFAIGIAAAG
jgi:hypothetical protein